VQALAGVVETGPDPAVDGVVRWRCSDLKVWIGTTFGVICDERPVARLLKGLGFSHIGPRPRHASQVPEVLDDFKKLNSCFVGIVVESCWIRFGNQRDGSRAISGLVLVCR